MVNSVGVSLRHTVDDKSRTPVCPETPVNGHDTITAAWVSLVRTDRSVLAPHLVAAAAERSLIPEKKHFRFQQLAQIWDEFRAHFYLVIAALLLGIAIATVLFQK